MENPQERMDILKRNNIDPQMIIDTVDIKLETRPIENIENSGIIKDLINENNQAQAST